MQVQSIQTELVHVNDDLFSVLSKALKTNIPERSVVVVTSKIIALCEGRVVNKNGSNKHDLVRQEAEWYTEPSRSKYDVMLAIKQNQLFVNAGIDESNADGQFVLWPKNPQQSANKIWSWLRETFSLSEIGVIVSDSKTTPLYWGVTGAAIAHCGFQTLSSKIGQSDLFGVPLKMTQVNVAQALAAAAVYEMGEASERTPLALVTDIRDITFQDQPPTTQELQNLRINLEEDVYEPILMSAPWKQGEGK